MDGSGDVFVADTDNSRVVELTPAGVQSTLGFTGLVYPGGVAVDASGDVFVADTDNSRVVELDARRGAVHPRLHRPVRAGRGGGRRVG